METALSAATDTGGVVRWPGGGESTGGRAEDGGAAGHVHSDQPGPHRSLEVWGPEPLAGTLGRIAVVECFSTSSCYLFEGTLTPTHMDNLRAGNGDEPAGLQVLSYKCAPKPHTGLRT